MKEIAKEFLDNFWVDGLIVGGAGFGAWILGISVLQLGGLTLIAVAIKALVKTLRS